jgi:hypothetical protein
MTTPENRRLAEKLTAAAVAVSLHAAFLLFKYVTERHVSQISLAILGVMASLTLLGFLYLGVRIRRVGGESTDG